MEIGDLKAKIFALLKEDEEFRYAVAGMLGLDEILRRLEKHDERFNEILSRLDSHDEKFNEILRRLDMHEAELVKLREDFNKLRLEQIKISEEQVRLREEQAKLREEQIKISEEQVRLREDFNKLRLEQIKISEEQVRLREDFNKLRLEQIKISEEQVRLREDFNKLRLEQIKISEEQVRLREDFNRMLAVIERMDLRLSRVERTLEKLTIDIEDEAKSIVRHKLAEVGINVDLTSLTLPDLELNIYGASNNICVVGEAAVRANVKLLNELLEKIEKLRRNYPWMVRDRLIPVLYVALPMADLISEAKSRGIWLLKATEEFYRPSNLTREN